MIKTLLRDNIKRLKPYTAARTTFSGKGATLMDANESPVNNGVNRYPDPLQLELKQLIAKRKGISVENIFVGNGSDETLDLLFRAFCEPQKDNVVILPPTYGMYKVLADINDVECRLAPLNEDFSLNLENVYKQVDGDTKIIFICSPNNPTGNSLNQEDILSLLNQFKGIVVIDEAYIDFSKKKTFTKSLDKFPQLFVNQTFSKSYSGAGIRLGFGFGSNELIQVLNTIKPPYNINELSQNMGIKLMRNNTEFESNISAILNEKKHLKERLEKLECIEEIFPSDANFFLIRVSDANAIYTYLLENDVIVRNRTNELFCKNTLRISIGAKQENDQLIDLLKSYNPIKNK